MSLREQCRDYRSTVAFVCDRMARLAEVTAYDNGVLRGAMERPLTQENRWWKARLGVDGFEDIVVGTGKREEMGEGLF